MKTPGGLVFFNPNEITTEMQQRFHETEIAERKRRIAKKDQAAQLRHKRRDKQPLVYIAELAASAIGRAKTKGIGYSPDLAQRLQPKVSKRCLCCGCRLDFSGANRNDAPSLDRVNSRLGYLASNVQIICGRCNRRKSDLSIKDLNMILAYMQHNLRR